MTLISKHTMPQSLRLKPLVNEDEPLYALDFLRSLTKQKKKRRHLKYKRRSGLTHLQMLSKTYTIP